jgi:lipopolysaccharide biosynthesis glycosyltransferase
MRDVCITIDSSYIQHAVVMLESLFEQSDTVYSIHIIINNSPKKFWTLKQFISYRGSISYFYQIDTDKLSYALISKHISLATYYRLLLAEILPDTLEKILFLDCDLLVLKDVDYLFNIDISEFDIAAIEEEISIDDKLRIGLNAHDIYINAGVMMVNLFNWRQSNLTNSFLIYLKNNHSNLLYWDQDIINGVIRKIKTIDKSWNVTELNYYKYFSRSVENINIIHFSGKCKPWNCDKHPLKFYYYFYLSKPLSFLKRFIYLRNGFRNILDLLKKRFYNKVLKEILNVLLIVFLGKKYYRNLFFYNRN